jgi:Asp-tRNA(Asn)/Glu-tRNA(Gln) amidotransferase A subunit family amidase
MAGAEHGRSRACKGFVPTETVGAIRGWRTPSGDLARTTVPSSVTGITESEVFGRTSNPWNLDRTAGGSSGGAAPPSPLDADRCRLA